MPTFDQAAHNAAKELDPAGCLAWLIPQAAPTWTFRSWLDTRTIPFPGQQDRTGDTVACLVASATPSAWWAVPVEFQVKPDPIMFGRLLEYLGRLWREQRLLGRKKERFPVGAVVVNLTGTERTSSRDFQLGQTGMRTCLQVIERNLAEEDAAATLAGIADGRIARCVLAWIPLMRGAGELSIIEEWKSLAAREGDSRKRGDYAGLALVFAQLGQCLALWRKGLEGWNVRESIVVKKWQDEARKEERIATLRESVLRALKARFGEEVPTDVSTRIEEQKKLAVLNRWFDQALTAATLDEFCAALSSR